MALLNQLNAEYGQPCWRSEDVPKAISTVGLALLSTEEVPYFLATHAPFLSLHDDKNNQRLESEEDVFKSVIQDSTREVLSVIHGEPGQGKSHLVHWLKLRTDDAVNAGQLKNLKTILIRRKTGTLKNALEQMIEQLGGEEGEFAHHIQPVKEALSRLNDQAARRKLVLLLSQELGDLRAERGKKPLPRELADLPQALRSEGLGRWLCRPGGAIDSTIRRLTEAPGADEFKAVSEFTTADLDPPRTYLLPKDVDGATIDLIDELDDDADRTSGAPLRQQAANEMNESLRTAIQEMTGLSGNRLFNIFADIRRAMKPQQTLALFIEDVSGGMGELDEEIIKAVEPEPQPDQCRMIAVLGLTTAGFNRLRENLKQRISHPITVATGGAWDDDDAIAGFTARYLNAIRLGDQRVRALADHRHGGRDIDRSACEGCAAVVECHAAFKKVTINGHDIGLFPLTKTAPHALLQRLSGTSHTPRALLTRLIAPILADKQNLLQDKRFPPSTLPVNPPGLSYWTAFERQYFSTWSESDKRRLQMLAGFWINAADEADAARQLAPLLSPLGFPSFKAAIKPKKETEGLTRKIEPVKPAAEPRQVTQQANRALEEFLARLNTWLNGGPFQRDEEPRDLVASLLGPGIPWIDERIPKVIWQSTLGGEGRKCINIDGQISKPVNTFFTVDLPRDKNTYELLEALAQFRHTGRNTWAFSNAPMFKRVVQSWLRTHTAEIVTRLKSAGQLDPVTPVAAAVRFLVAVALFRSRGKLPEQRDEMIKALLAEAWTESEPPATLSGGLRDLLVDMRRQHAKVREFLFTELNLPQGPTGGINYIDPRPLLEHAPAFINDLRIHPLDPAYFTSYWKPRYANLQGINAAAVLSGKLAAERAALAAEVLEIEKMLTTAGYETVDLHEAITQYCNDLAELIATRREQRFTPTPHPEFDSAWRARKFDSAETWGRKVAEARQLSAPPSPVASETSEAPDPATDQNARDLAVILFDPRKLSDARKHLQLAGEYVTALHEAVEEVRADLFKEQADAALEPQLLQMLHGVAVATGAVKPVNPDDPDAEAQAAEVLDESQDTLEADDVEND